MGEGIARLDRGFGAAADRMQVGAVTDAPGLCPFGTLLGCEVFLVMALSASFSLETGTTTSISIKLPTI